MSHEIRTPMNAILGFSELLKNRQRDEKHEGYVDGILAGGNILLGIINNILDLSKIEAGSFPASLNTVSLEQVTADLRALFKNRTTSGMLRFQVEIDKRVPSMIIVDETRLRQILLNIVGNAFKFTQKGHVKLVIRATEVKETFTLLIEVSDTGIGMTEENVSKVFNAFFQQDTQMSKQYDGTGLGLTIAKKLVELMGGTIDLSSDLGKGTTFLISLPGIHAVRGGKLAKALEAPLLQSRFLPSDVMLVEDNISNRAVIRGLLQYSGLNLIEFDNGTDALEYIQNKPPSLILLDIMLPDIDGLAVHKQIRNNPLHAEIPIVFVSASLTLKSKLELDDYTAFLSKPFKGKELYEHIAAYLPRETYQAEPSGADVILDAQLFDLSPSQRKGLERKFSAQLLEIESLMSNDDIEDLAKKVIRYAYAHDLPGVGAWAKRLLVCAQVFDIEKMNSMFFEFSHYVHPRITGNQGK